MPSARTKVLAAALPSAPEVYSHRDQTELRRIIEQALNRIENTGVLSGTGTPESVVAAPVGTLFRRLDGGAGTSLYVKESGTGTTGWAAK